MHLKQISNEKCAAKKRDAFSAAFFAVKLKKNIGMNKIHKKYPEERIG